MILLQKRFLPVVATLLCSVSYPCNAQEVSGTAARPGDIDCIPTFSTQSLQPEQHTQPRWWKGNLHTHSLWSDGNDFPEMIADWYRQQDYNFLALSDHNVMAEGIRFMKYKAIIKRGGSDALQKYRTRFGESWVETKGDPDSENYSIRLKPLNEFRSLVEEKEKFILLTGEEISDKAEGKPVHMNATNLQEVIQPVGGATVREAIENNFRALQEQAEKTKREMMMHLNHPNFFYAVTAEDLAAVFSERFYEVYNGHPGINHLGDDDHASVERIWDIANTIRIGQFKSAPLYGLGTDDSHHYHGEDIKNGPGRGWVMVQSQHLTPEHLIRAMKRGDFYASSGVTLRDVAFNADTQTFSIEIEPSGTEQYEIEFIGTRTGYDATSEPVVGADGKPVRATRLYSDDVGEVLATANGLRASYQLKGDELYVRAVVTSSDAHHDPSFKGQHKQAWTQPVGWGKLMSSPATEQPYERRLQLIVRQPVQASQPLESVLLQPIAGHSQHYPTQDCPPLQCAVERSTSPPCPVRRGPIRRLIQRRAPACCR